MTGGSARVRAIVPVRAAPGMPDTYHMNREGAETYLRLLGEAELRGSLTAASQRLWAGGPGISGGGRAKLIVVSQALIAVGALDAQTAEDIVADFDLAVSVRLLHEQTSQGPGPAGAGALPSGTLPPGTLPAGALPAGTLPAGHAPSRSSPSRSSSAGPDDASCGGGPLDRPGPVRRPRIANPGEQAGGGLAGWERRIAGPGGSQGPQGPQGTPSTPSTPVKARIRGRIGAESTGSSQSG